MKVTAQELLQMYNELKASFNCVSNELRATEQKLDDCRKTLQAQHQVKLALEETQEELLSVINIHEQKSKTQEELIEVLKQALHDAEFRLENKQNYEQFCEKQKNTCGVEKTGDLNDYEYMSDGKRMCFQNYQTGNRVYAGDELFSVLKNRMLRGED